MEKSKHNTYNRFTDIPVEELVNFINPINISFYIDRNDLHSLFSSTTEISNLICEIISKK